MDTRRTARGLLALTRPSNSVAGGVLTFVGAYVAGGLSTPVPVALAVGATVAASAGGMAVNDYFDREVDAVNDPDRPIPSGAVSPRGALALAGACFVAAVAMALALPPLAIAVAGVNLVALVAYTEYVKGTPGLGNALVAYLGGSTFLFGAAAVEGLSAGPLVLFALAALATFGREVVKDVEDRPGDEAAGLQTLPVVVGDRPALALAACAVVVAVAASPLPYLHGSFGVTYLALVVPADVAMLAAAGRAFADPAAGQRLLKAGMYAATAAFVVGRAVPTV
ncbi:MAG: geranylgeranylglycerol-phosphate geranylgeranyltransferase [Halobacteriaceae archaeon]